LGREEEKRWEFDFGGLLEGSEIKRKI